MTYGQLVRHRRIEANMPLRWLAASLGTSASYVSQVERGQRGPFSKEIELRLIDSGLGLTQDELDRARARSRSVAINVHGLSELAITVVLEIARRVNDGSMSVETARAITEVLEGPAHVGGSTVPKMRRGH